MQRESVAFLKKQDWDYQKKGHTTFHRSAPCTALHRSSSTMVSSPNNQAKKSVTHQKFKNINRDTIKTAMLREAAQRLSCLFDGKEPWGLSHVVRIGIKGVKRHFDKQKDGASVKAWLNKRGLDGLRGVVNAHVGGKTDCPTTGVHEIKVYPNFHPENGDVFCWNSVHFREKNKLSEEIVDDDSDSDDDDVPISKLQRNA